MGEFTHFSVTPMSCRTQQAMKERVNGPFFLNSMDIFGNTTELSGMDAAPGGALLPA
jgi:hypothetical protein